MDKPDYEGFAKAVVDNVAGYWWDLDGADVQEIGLKFGVLKTVRKEAYCAEGSDVCACMEFGELGNIGYINCIEKAY